MQQAELLQQFENHLRIRRLVPENQAPYYVKWVQRFHQFCPPGSEADSGKIESFIHFLENSDELADRQIRQAHQAVTLFLQFSESPLEPAASSKTPPEESQDHTWESAIHQMRRLLRLKHYAARTEQSYVDWVKRFAAYARKERPGLAGATEVKHYITQLALERRVSASTQNQAFNGLLFFFRWVLKQDLSGLGDTVRARHQRRLPVVLSRQEVQQVLAQMDGTTSLMARLVYGSGLRLMECVRLRVQDLDFDQRLLIIRSGKGDKDRTTMLPDTLIDDLRSHLQNVKRIHEADLSKGHGEVRLPDAIERKYPNAGKQWQWQYVFPSATLSVDQDNGVVRRFHTAESTLQKAVAAAARKAGIAKRASVHTLRHSFATHLLEAGTNIRMIQELLGHKSVETTMVYTRVMQQDAWKVRSPLDRF